MWCGRPTDLAGAMNVLRISVNTSFDLFLLKLFYAVTRCREVLPLPEQREVVGVGGNAVTGRRQAAMDQTGAANVHGEEHTMLMPESK